MNDIEDYEDRQTVRMLIEAGHSLKEAHYFVKHNPGMSFDEVQRLIHDSDYTLLATINREKWFCIHHKTLPARSKGCDTCGLMRNGTYRSGPLVPPSNMLPNRLEVAFLTEFYEFMGFNPYVIDIVLSRRVHKKMPIDPDNVLDELESTHINVEKLDGGKKTVVTISDGGDPAKRRGKEDFYDKFHKKEYCEAECVVCFNKLSDTLFEPCGHKAVCFDCAYDIVRLSGTCPLCSGEISKVVKIN